MRLSSHEKFLGKRDEEERESSIPKRNDVDLPFRETISAPPSAIF